MNGAPTWISAKTGERELDMGIGWIAEQGITAESKEERYPEIGPFYYYKGIIIAPDEFQRRINPASYVVESVRDVARGMAKEHRDMWDGYMVVRYPELKTDYDDDHKESSVSYACALLSFDAPPRRAKQHRRRRLPKGSGSLAWVA